MLSANSINFIATGISADVSGNTGRRYLDHTGPYNELITGGGTFNLGVINYASGAASTPQLLLIREEHETSLIGLNISNMKNSQTLIEKITGQFEIQEFYEFVKNSPAEEVLERMGYNSSIE
ncbi:MAG: hypothetical protein ACNA78_08290 [Balneolaceae bacterium]